MSDFQKDIEQIIKSNIATMTVNRQQKRTLHVTSQSLELLGELYDNDEDATVFVNHFGHIEYFNRAFGKIMMLDRQDSPLKSIYNLNQLNIGFELENEVLNVTYPNGSVHHFAFSHQLVNFQKSFLLQMQFKDISDIHRSTTALKDLQLLTDHYLKHLTSPMFLLDSEGKIVHIPDNNLTVFGKKSQSMKGENIFEVLPFDYANEVMAKIKLVTEKTDGHFMYQTENDRMVKVFDTTVRLVDENLFLCLINDVSDLNTMSSTIEYLNSYDSLTGFYNANYYENTVAQFKNSGHLPMGIYVLSLNGLKQVNLRLGYHQCDNLLIEIALNMKSLISQHEIPCRITGDTFLIFFPNISKDTMDKFGTKMTEYIESYKEKYKDYRLSYIEKNILVTDSTTNIQSLLRGMIV